MNFTLAQVDGEVGKYRLASAEGYESDALEFAGVKQAKRFAESYTLSNEPAPFILIRNNRVADAHGFWLHTISTRGNGKSFVTVEQMLVSCNTARNN